MEHLGIIKVKSFGFLIFAVKIQLDAQVLALSFIIIPSKLLNLDQKCDLTLKLLKKSKDISLCCGAQA